MVNKIFLCYLSYKFVRYFNLSVTMKYILLRISYFLSYTLSQWELLISANKFLCHKTHHIEMHLICNPFYPNSDNEMNLVFQLSSYWLLRFLADNIKLFSLRVRTRIEVSKTYTQERVRLIAFRRNSKQFRWKHFGISLSLQPAESYTYP